MTRSSGSAKAIALALAITAHGALALTLTAPEATLMEGTDGAAEVRLGNAFQDMAAGTLSAERADTSIEATLPETTPAERPEHIEAEQTSVTQPTPARTIVEPESAQEIKSTEPVVTAAIAPETTAPAVPDGTLAPSRTETLAAQPALERHMAEPDSTAVTRSLRPKPRSDEFVTAHKPPTPAKPKPKTTAQPTARQKQPQGNASKDARAGEATGRAEATARQSGSGASQQTTGNAAASNYPGLVMRKLSRAGKPRVNARGAAVIAFTISANGGLTSVSLARSSGSAALDQAAVRLVRGAGPFPQPPRGAQRSFSIQIKGR